MHRNTKATQEHQWAQRQRSTKGTTTLKALQVLLINTLNARLLPRLDKKTASQLSGERAAKAANSRVCGKYSECCSQG